MQDKKLYDKSYFVGIRGGNNSDRKEMYKQELQCIWDRVSRGMQGTVLDIGCGDGAFLDQFPVWWTKYGMDISEYAQDIAFHKGIRFEEPDDGSVDLVIFRGTIQHLDQPLKIIAMVTSKLKVGGTIVFLATPNINSIYYKLFNRLPMLNPKYNYMLVSDLILKQILENYGYENIEFKYPYIDTPYAKPFRDLFNFLLSCIGIKRKFAFWGNILECYAIKGG